MDYSSLPVLGFFWQHGDENVWDNTGVQFINDVVGFHPRRWEKKTNHTFSQLQKAIVFSPKFQVLLFLTSFLLCTVKLVRPPFQNTRRVAYPIHFWSWSISFSWLLFFTKLLVRTGTRTARRPGGGTWNTCRLVSGESSPWGYIPAVCMPHLISYAATGPRSPQKCPLLLFLFSL